MKRVNPAVLVPLQDALASIYYYKNDLRVFLEAATGDRALISRFNWDGQYKRVTVREYVAVLVADEHKYHETLVKLIISVSTMDPVHLLKLENGRALYDIACDAVTRLRAHSVAFAEEVETAAAAEHRLLVDRQMAEKRREIDSQLDALKSSFVASMQLTPQARGYKLEEILNQLFSVFEIPVKGSFRNAGEQIDGAFTHDNTEYLLEAKWLGGRVSTDAIDVFVGKVERKLDNTLGLLVSMNGFEASAQELAGIGRRPKVLLMDGEDLLAVLDRRATMPEVLTRKRQHAARTGEVYFRTRDMLT